MKTLLPTLREKKRYVVFEVMSKENVSMRDTAQEFQKAFESTFGSFTAARAGIQFMPDWKKQKGIIRAAHRYTDHIKSTFVMLHDIKGVPAVIKTVTVSGILNKARKKMEA